MASFGGTYSTGTVSLTNGDATATFVGSLLSTQAVEGDLLFFPSLGLLAYVSVVTDDTHIEMSDTWAQANQSAIEYILLKNSWTRYDPAATQQKTRDMLTFFEGIGFFYFVSGASPDPAVGEDGNWALKTNDGSFSLWYHTGGVWVSQGSLAAPSGVMHYTNTTEATGNGTHYAARFEGGVEIAKKLFVADAVWLGLGASFAGAITYGTLNQYSAKFSARAGGANYEFGHGNAAGYGSVLGSEANSGAPFLAFCAGPGTNGGNTYKTLGLLGSVLKGDGNGGFVFGTLAASNGDNQSLTNLITIPATGGLSVISATGASLKHQFTFTGTPGIYAATYSLDGAGLKIGHNSAARNIEFQTASTTRVTIAAGGDVALASTTASTSPTTGALMVGGGVGVGGAGFFGGNLTCIPGASVTPATNGQLAFQATSNTSLTFKYKGSDGVVRSGSITLA